MVWFNIASLKIWTTSQKTDRPGWRMIKGEGGTITTGERVTRREGKRQYESCSEQNCTPCMSYINHGSCSKERYVCTVDRPREWEWSGCHKQAQALLRGQSICISWVLRNVQHPSPTRVTIVPLGTPVAHRSLLHHEVKYTPSIGTDTVMWSSPFFVSGNLMFVLDKVCEQEALKKTILLKPEKQTDSETDRQIGIQPYQFWILFLYCVLIMKFSGALF